MARKISERTKELKRQYVAEHREEMAAYLRAYRIAHRERLLRQQHDWYVAHREHCIALSMRNAAAHPEKCKNRTRVWRQRHPEKWSALRQLAAAIRNGRIKRGPCIACGSPDSEGHHEDYSKPLDVIWLCHRCHIALHAHRKYQYVSAVGALVDACVVRKKEAECGQA